MTDDAGLHRFSAFVDLTAGEAEALRALADRPEQRGAGDCIMVEGCEPSRLFLLHEGWVLSSVSVATGGRQFVKVHRPGDVMGAPSLAFTAAMESLTALTPARVSAIPLDRLGALFIDWPRLGAVLFLLAQEERTILMARLVSLGRLSAAQRFAELLLAMHEAHPAAHGGTKVHLPLTQDQLGDVLGLSTVHINRVVRDLLVRGLIRRDRYVYDLVDVARLEAFVGLPRRVRQRNPSWLPAAR